MQAAPEQYMHQGTRRPHACRHATCEIGGLRVAEGGLIKLSLCLNLFS